MSRAGEFLLIIERLKFAFISDIFTLTWPWSSRRQASENRATSLAEKDESEQARHKRFLLYLALHDSIIQSVFRKHVEK